MLPPKQQSKEYPMNSFNDKTILITGAAGNLGQTVARAFWQAGANLALADRRPDRLAGLFPQVAGSPRGLLITGIDITSAEDTGRMAAESIARFGRIDVLVNTAGGFRAGTPVAQSQVSDWEAMINLNARSVFLACRTVLPAMLENHSGKIINIAARAALQGKAGMAAYTASKSAVVRLTESISAEVKAEGINVNCILPGTIDTPQNRKAMPQADFSRWVSPESLAGVILFLASPQAADIHGAALPVYGLS